MRVIYFFLLFTTNDLCANSDSLIAINLLRERFNNIELKVADEFNNDIQKGLSIFSRQDDLLNWFYWQIVIGRKLGRVGEYDEAIKFLENAIKGMWRKAKTDDELRYLAMVYAELGIVYEKINALHFATKYYEQYKTIYKDSLDKSAIYMANYIYNRLGNFYSGLRDEAKSNYYFDEAKRISKKESNWKLYVKICRNQGEAYKGLNKYDLSEEAYLEALKWKDSLSVYGKLDLFIDIGLNYYQLSNYKEARYFTDLAKLLFDKNIEEFSKRKQADYQYSFYYNYGRINKGEKNYREAESFYLKAIQLLKEYPELRSRRQKGIMQINFGELYLEQQQFDKAQEYFHEAITYLSPLLSEYKDPHLVPIYLLNGEYLLGYAYQKLGNIAVAQYEQDQKKTYLHKAIRYYELTDFVNQLRLQNYTTEESILTALAEQKDLKEDMQFALYKLYQHNPRDSIKEKMLTFSEKSRSFLLLEKDKLSKDIEVWDEASRKNYYIKQAKRQTLEETIYALGEADTEDEVEEFNRLKGEWLKVNEELADLQRKKNKDSKFKLSQPASLNTIRQTLDDDQGLIEFFVGEAYIYTYAISSQGLKVYQKSRTEAFVLAIEQLRNTLVCDHDAIEMFGSNASYLFETLLKEPLGEFPNAVDRLVLVPDHLLNFIPFEILLTSPYDNKMHHYNMPYLIRKYSISPANSATLYTLQQQKNEVRAERLFAGYAPRFHADNIPEQDTCEMQKLASLVREGYSELKGARKEVNKIARTLRGDSIIGKNAMKSHFITEADRYRILLLSTHGFVNSENPHFSKLLFAPASSQNKADDVLTALELYNLNLNAELVVVSACNTGSGTLYPGEGVFSFSRAFFAAGVPSTVMTLWKVDDESTSEVMVSFFEYLKKDLPKDKALQQAKLDYLKNNKKDKLGLHPYYWSGILVSGNTHSLNLEKESFPRIYVLLFFLLLSIFALRFFSKKI